MERKEQTGHICRWMGIGIIVATVIVGCTIMIGLFEWRDRKNIENKNAELHLWRKNALDLNMCITELSLLSETAAGWDSAHLNRFHSLRLEVNEKLQNIANICPKSDMQKMQYLLSEKENLLLAIRDAINERNDIHSRLAVEIPKIVEKSKKENNKVIQAQNCQPKKKKEGWLKRLFGKKEKEPKPVAAKAKPTQTTKMLTTLHQDVLTKHQRQSRKVHGILDSLSYRNEVINNHLQRVITIVDAKVNDGIAKCEQQINDIENKNPYYYICMLGMLLPVLGIMFFLVRQFERKMHKSQAEMEKLITELQNANKQNKDLLDSRRKTLLTIVHELRSPLSSIAREATKMLEGDADLPEKKIRSIQQSTNMMSEMIDGLLTFYRLDSGKETLVKKPINLKSISETLRLEYSQQAIAAGLSLEVHDNAYGIVIADKLKLLRIGRNLLSNAIKYSSAGTIMLRTEYINGIYTMSVSDNGTGMSKEQTGNIFKAFHRLGNAVTKDGFGLGLSIVESIVKLMKGSVNVESEQGRGSIFTVRIPMERADSPKNVTACYQGMEQSDNYKIIAIDDSEAQLEIIREAFAVTGMSCDTCKNVDELMAKMRENEYDLLITDLKMPDYDGYAVLELLRMSNIRNSRTIPVLILTASDNITEEEFIDAGFSGCVFKPVSFDELKKKVDECIKAVNKERVLDFSKLMAYGNGYRLLETIANETQDELANIKAIATLEDREKMQGIIHHLYSSWGIIGADQPLRALSRLLKQPSSTDEDINMAVSKVVRLAEVIISEATKQIGKEA